MNSFLASVQTTAFRMAFGAVGSEAEALDVVQDAMLTMAQRYAHKPATQWKPLFYRVLRNRITDSHRQAQRGRRRFTSLFQRSVEGEESSLLESEPAPVDDEPAQRVRDDRLSDAVVTAVAELPERQQQAFVLRAVEGMNVAETAQAMGCTGGSVKTHYSRALRALRERLQQAGWTPDGMSPATVTPTRELG